MQHNQMCYIACLLLITRPTQLHIVILVSTLLNRTIKRRRRYNKGVIKFDAIFMTGIEAEPNEHAAIRS